MPLVSLRVEDILFRGSFSAGRDMPLVGDLRPQILVDCTHPGAVHEEDVPAHRVSADLHQ